MGERKGGKGRVRRRRRSRRRRKEGREREKKGGKERERKRQGESRGQEGRKGGVEKTEKLKTIDVHSSPKKARSLLLHITLLIKDHSN